MGPPAPGIWFEADSGELLNQSDETFRGSDETGFQDSSGNDGNVFLHNRATETIWWFQNKGVTVCLFAETWINMFCENVEEGKKHFEHFIFLLSSLFVSCQGEDVTQAPAGVSVVVLCLLRGLALLPPSEPQQHLLCSSSVTNTHTHNNNNNRKLD